MCRETAQILGETEKHDSPRKRNRGISDKMLLIRKEEGLLLAPAPALVEEWEDELELVAFCEAVAVAADCSMHVLLELKRVEAVAYDGSALGILSLLHQALLERVFWHLEAFVARPVA